MHTNASRDSRRTRQTLPDRGLSGKIAHEGEKASIKAGRRQHVERTNASRDGFNRLEGGYRTPHKHC